MTNQNGKAGAAPEDDYGLVRACRRLHAAIDQLDDKTARLLQVSRNDLRCLNLLENGLVTPKSLASSLNLTTGSVTSLLDRLERKNFVRRIAHPQDRRALLIELQPKAFAQIGAIYREFGEAVVALAEHYTASKSQQAVKHLSDVADVCERVTESIGSRAT